MIWDFFNFTLMRSTWEKNPASRNSRLTCYLLYRSLTETHCATVSIASMSNEDDQVANTL